MTPVATWCRYLQGIKFYEPELAKDTPQAVERDGMRALLAATAEHLGREEGKTLLSPGAHCSIRQVSACSSFLCAAVGWVWRAWGLRE